MSLSLQDCQNLVASHYEAVSSKQKKKAKRLEHAGRVLSLCREIIPRLPSPPVLQTDLLFQAALLHDIAKFDCDETHHLDAAAIMKQELGPKEAAANSELLNRLDKVISPHKDAFAPPPEFAPEAAVLRMADKIDQFRRKTRKAAKAQEKAAEARKKADLAELEKDTKKRKKKQEKLAGKLEDLRAANAALQKAEHHYQDSLARIDTYAQGAAHGGCDSEFVQSLRTICDSLKALPLPDDES